METISIFLSVLAILATAFTYVVHDRRLKRQEILINNYQLKKNQEEETEQKKALMRANVVKGRGNITLKIYNAGKSTARNIKLKIKEEDRLILMSNPFPYEFMHPQDHTDLNIHLIEGAPEKINIVLTWEDDNQLVNQHHQILTL